MDITLFAGTNNAIKKNFILIFSCKRIDMFIGQISRSEISGLQDSNIQNSNRASLVTQLVKNPPASAGDLRDLGSVAGLGRSPEEGNGNPLRYSCLENPMDRGAWRCTVHRVAERGTRLRTHPAGYVRVQLIHSAEQWRLTLPYKATILHLKISTDTAKFIFREIYIPNKSKTSNFPTSSSTTGYINLFNLLI